MNVAHLWGPQRPLTDSFGKHHGYYRVCQVCGMSDHHGADKACAWPTCGTCPFRIEGFCYRFPPKPATVASVRPRVGERTPACGEHPQSAAARNGPAIKIIR